MGRGVRALTHAGEVVGGRVDVGCDSGAGVLGGGGGRARTLMPTLNP